jgi:hypothetical protein
MGGQRKQLAESTQQEAHLLEQLTSDPRRATSPCRWTMAVDEESPRYRHPLQKGGVGIRTSALS